MGILSLLRAVGGIWAQRLVAAFERCSSLQELLLVGSRRGRLDERPVDDVAPEAAYVGHVVSSSPVAEAEGAGVTVKLNIIPLSWCSAMWQYAIQTPGLVTSRRMSTVWPVRTSTVSFQTRLGSTSPLRARIRKRPAPWMWKGWCIGWSCSMSLTRRIFTWSPTRNAQSISQFSLPVS